MKSPDSDIPLPLLRCADDFIRRFGSLWSSKNLLKSLLFGLCMIIALGLAQWLGGDKLQVIPVLAGMAWVIWQIFKFRSFFATLTCPHCGKPVGSNPKKIRRGNPFPRDGILHLRCCECGLETRTDLRVWAGSGWPEKVS